MKDHLQEVQIHQGNLFILYLEIETETEKETEIETEIEIEIETETEIEIEIEIEVIIGNHLIQIEIGDIEERNIVVQDLILEALGQGLDLIRDNVSL